MGDDAELYWEMEHNPYFWDEVESCSRNNSFTENKSKKKKIGRASCRERV